VLTLWFGYLVLVGFLVLDWRIGVGVWRSGDLGNNVAHLMRRGRV
jgi:hypothetical protein